MSTVAESEQNKQFYHHMSEHRDPVTDMELQRMQFFVELIPDQVSCILELGCGDGRVLQAMQGRFQVLGLDISQGSLKKARERCGPDVPLFRASVDHLPFQENSTDAVVLTEVVEHLPEDLIRTLSQEVSRVSRRYLLISVPYRETVSASYLRCKDCRHQYHVWGHQRSYTPAKLCRQLPHWRYVSHALKGPIEARPSELLGRLTRRWATFARSDERARACCPQCGSQKAHENDTWLARRLYSAFWHSRSITRKQLPIWLNIVFERK